MLTYSTGVTLFLGYVAFTSPFAGILLWPVVILHLILTALLARVLTSKEKR
ncbi:MAG: hypothetical protein RLZZ214_4294 [Verrucomicrobiota bacterium]|jgi:hypothetical protein